MRKRAVLVALATVAVGVVCISQQRAALSDERETIRRGDRIVLAIRAYQKDKLAFPGNLSELVPGYIDVIETPTWGERKWFYVSNNDRQTFTLRVGDAWSLGEELAYLFRNNEGKWAHIDHIVDD